MNYLQPKLERRECIKCRLSVDGSKKEYHVSHDNLNDTSTDSKDYRSMVSIISQDFYHFLKSKNIHDSRFRKKVVYCINIFISYLTFHQKKELTFYKLGLIEDFLLHWYPHNYPKAPAGFIYDLCCYIIYFYEYLLSLNWIDRDFYNSIKKELEAVKLKESFKY